MTILCFLYCLLGFCSFTHQYGSNKVLVTCECLMTASIILPDTTTCCLGHGPPPKVLSNIRDEDDGGDGDNAATGPSC